MNLGFRKLVWSERRRARSWRLMEDEEPSRARRLQYRRSGVGIIVTTRTDKSATSQSAGRKVKRRQNEVVKRENI